MSFIFQFIFNTPPALPFFCISLNSPLHHLLGGGGLYVCKYSNSLRSNAKGEVWVVSLRVSREPFNIVTCPNLFISSGNMCPVLCLSAVYIKTSFSTQTACLLSVPILFLSVSRSTSIFDFFHSSIHWGVSTVSIGFHLETDATVRLG